MYGYLSRCIGLFREGFALTNGLDTSTGSTNFSKTSSACILMLLPITPATQLSIRGMEG